jgi:predicted  nucleic acid-binding Zn ribbon protein
MYTFDLIFKNKNPNYEDIVHDIYTLTYMLGSCGQILQREHILCINGDATKVQVVCPEMGALDDTHANQDVLNWKNRIEKGLKNKIRYKYTGIEPDYPSPRYDVPTEKSSFYILRYGWSSPLICGDTNTPIPLYKIPYTDVENTCYDNIWNWERHHKSLYHLWLGSQEVTEEFAANQMQDVYSEHNKKGRDLCRIIEEKTGVSTFYFLFNYRNWSKQEDLDRKCPITGNEWGISDKTNKPFVDFKCDESRLVSELSANCEDD